MNEITNETVKELQAAAEWFSEHGKNTNTAIVGICERAVDLINRERAEIERLREILISDGKTTYTAEIARQAWHAQNSEHIRRLELEIERLSKCNERQRRTIRAYHIGETKAEAIKEFAERLKEKADKRAMYYGREFKFAVCNDVDNLVKEMTEDAGK